jgi:hypothetical protein
MLLPILLLLPGLAQATEYTDRPTWEAAVTGIQTAPFTGYANGTIITNQYQSIGMTYTQGNDTVFLSSAFPTDGAGLSCNGNMIISFSSPQTAIGIDFPGALSIDLYSGGTLVYASGNFAGAGSGFFAGIITTATFDSAIIDDWVDGAAYVDNVSIAGTGLSLTVTGSCPGLTGLSISNATPGGNIALALSGSLGSFVIPGSFVCSGTVLGLGGTPALVAVFSADNNGNASLSRNLPPSVCGRYIQVVDLSSCTPSNVAQL